MTKKANSVRKKNVESRLDEIRSDLGTLQTEVVTSAGDISEVAGERAGAIMRAASDLADRAFHIAEEAAAELAGDVEGWTTENFETARETVRMQPFAALAVALGAGIVLGAFLLRR